MFIPLLCVLKTALFPHDRHSRLGRAFEHICPVSCPSCPSSPPASCLRLGPGLLVFQQTLDELVGTIHISIAGNGLCSKRRKQVQQKLTK